MSTHVLVFVPALWFGRRTSQNAVATNSAARVHLAAGPLLLWKVVIVYPAMSQWLGSLVSASLHNAPLSASDLLFSSRCSGCSSQWPGHLWQCLAARIRLTPQCAPVGASPAPVWPSLLAGASSVRPSASARRCRLSDARTRPSNARQPSQTSQSCASNATRR